MRARLTGIVDVRAATRVGSELLLHVTRSGTQNLASGSAYTTILFNTTTLDSENLYNATTGALSIRVSGYYRLTLFSFQVGNLSAANIRARIDLQNVTAGTSLRITADDTTTGLSVQFATTCIVLLTAGSTYAVQVSCDGTGTPYLVSDGATWFPTLVVERVSR